MNDVTHEGPEVGTIEPRVVTHEERIPMGVYNSASSDKMLHRQAAESLKDLVYEAADKRLADHKVATVNFRGEEVDEEDATHYLVQSGMIIGDPDAEGKVKDPLETAQRIVRLWYENTKTILTAPAPERNDLTARIADAIARAKGFDE